MEAHFATKSVVLTQRQFRRDFPGRNRPSKLTIRCLLEKFRETEGLGIKIKDTVVGHDLQGQPTIIETVIQRRGAWIDHVINY